MLYMVADGVLALASFWAAHAIRSRLATLRPLYPAYYYIWIVPVAAGIWLAVGVAAGIYREIREDELGHAFLDPLKVSLISTMLLLALTSALKVEYISRLMLGLFATLDLVAMISFRLLARNVG